jgi:hypothetical protein
MGKNKEIYWGIFNDFPTNSLLNMEPKPLLKDLAESQKQYPGSNFVSCPSIANKFKNTFISHIPYDIDFFYLNGEYRTNRPNVIFPRTGLYENSHALDFNLQRIFFSATPQIMEVTPAFLHQTPYTQYGHAPSGSFDISKWFRPSSPTFQMWKNINSFSAKENDPHLYFNFPNENKIILKQFYVTDRLIEIALSNVNHKSLIPKQNLNSLYDRFIKSNQNKIILKEINENLF